MKLEPIKNPHSKTGQVHKKTKQEEREELIEKTKRSAIDKYGVSLPITNSPVEKISRQEVLADSSGNERFRLKRKTSLHNSL